FKTGSQNLWTIFKGELKACRRTELQPISQEPPAAKLAIPEQQARLPRTQDSQRARPALLDQPARPDQLAVPPREPQPRWLRSTEVKFPKLPLRLKIMFQT